MLILILVFRLQVTHGPVKDGGSMTSLASSNIYWNAYSTAVFIE